MTVAELIKILSKYPPGARVLLGDWSEEWNEPNEEAVEKISWLDGKVIIGR